MFIKRRGATAARLCFDASRLPPTLQPNHHHARADPIEFRNLTPRCPTFNCFNYQHTQILRIRLRHWVPQNRINELDSLTDTLLGIHPIQSDRKTLLALAGLAKQLFRDFSHTLRLEAEFPLKLLERS